MNCMKKIVLTLLCMISGLLISEAQDWANLNRFRESKDRKSVV